VEVEVVDAPLDYNLLLGRNWTYSMIVVMSSVFHTLCFPHEGNIVTIDQYSFAYSIPNASLGPSIPVIENSQQTTEIISVRMYSPLMGTFEFSTPSHHIYYMSSTPISIGRSIPLCTYYFNDLWTLPSSTSSCEGQSHAGISIPLSDVEIVYQVFLKYSVDPDLVPSPTDKEDLMSRPMWAT
jgi:hypothetical protein